MPRTILQWLSLVGIIWLQSINGTNTNFPAYSSQLKDLLFISQIQLNNLAFASDAGKLFGWLSGFAAKYLPIWLVLILGSALGLIGYGVPYLFLIGRISNLSYRLVFFLTILAGNSICWINTVCYLVTIRNFPLDRQLAIGLTGSYLGLSAKIYTVIVNVVFASSPDNRARAYLFLSSVLPFTISVISAPVVRVINVGKSKRAKAAFISILVITTATGVFAVMGSLGSASSWLSPFTSAVGMVALLLAPLLIPLGKQIRQLIVVRLKGLNREEKVYIEENVSMEKMEMGVKERESISETRETISDTFELSFRESISEIDDLSESGDDNTSGTNEINVMEEIGVKLMLRRLNFWLYFFVYLFGITLGLVFANNLGQIAESRGCSASVLVSLSSSFGFFGRLIPSFVDYFFSRGKYMISRTAFVVALMAPTGGAFFLLVNSTNLSLFISTAIIGVCTGAITSISVSLTTELFGTKNFGVNHNVVVVNIPIGSCLFGYLAALIYRKEGNADGKCFGMECYRKTFILWGTLCFLGTFLALILYARTRKFYNSQRSP
ncbi:protein NUCLEAR FUSION DEFECTIVE 4 [Durio zibethinus]|uniref:Protein NUCLEAR FUSION DEFECTIVE 4 n=1 Tax=Durio zibethinus TaxID=66656 RepID=A0A6P5XW26_DURZI|nr:protein NUCLEAR FUSION DEFECTIVE 4 [Durio zibethinus]